MSLLLIALTSAVCSVRAGVVVNEIMYHPSSERVDEEYIELYNAGTSAVNLQGWRLSKGIAFTFTNSTPLAPGACLVVVANPAAFQAKYSTVTNFVGSWTGILNNSDQSIHLETPEGNVADEISYADEGDYAIRRRAPQSYLHRGWEWYAEHDGLGKSLERINPLLSGTAGANWTSSGPTNGTPGLDNSTYRTNTAPLILSVAHYPLVPQSTNPVTITARLVDDFPGPVTATLSYRRADSTSPPPWTTVTMFDDGAHQDGVSGDGLFGVSVPANGDKSIIEFFITGSDAQSHARTWPAPALTESNQPAQVCNAMFMVDNEVSDPLRPSYRLIMTRSDHDELYSIPNEGDPNNYSEAAYNGTFISTDGQGTHCRYLCSFRNRGESSRSAQPPNYHINIPSDRRWNGVSAFNLNSMFTHCQVIGSLLATTAGLPTEYHHRVELRVNGIQRAAADLKQFGSYVHQEVADSDFAANHFPDDPKGNIYRARIYPYYADLSYKGTNVSSYTNTTNGGYAKGSNKSENDWSDLIALADVLSNTPDPQYWQKLQEVADVREWARYFAVFSLIGSEETSLGTGYGDDYNMYRGMLDPRFRLVGHDWDTILGQGDTAANVSKSIFRATQANSYSQNAAVNRFLKHPEVAPVYYAELAYQLSNTFAPASVSRLIDQSLGSWVPEYYTTIMKTFATNRADAVWLQIPTSLSVTSALPRSAGYPVTTSSTASLTGKAPAIRSRHILVNGAPAAYVPWQASWSAPAVPLNPGLNRISVQALDSSYREVARTNIDIWYSTGASQTVAGTIVADTLWTASQGPYQVTGSITVATNTTLTIEAGTTVYLASGVDIVVNDGGRLLALGSSNAPVRFAVAPGSGVVWGGITIDGSPGSPESRFTYTHIEGNDDVCIHATEGTLLLDHVTFGTTTRQYLSLDGASFLVSDCVFPSAAPGALFELAHGTGGIKTGGRGIFIRNFFGVANSVSGNYNDVVDFSGGQRPGPIVHFINNVFIGTGDDHLDLDDTDAWIEGNIFLHAHKNGSPDTSSAISAGTDTGKTSDLTIVRNLIYDCDHAALAKQGNYYSLLNNTIVRQTHNGGLDTEGAVICLQDNGMTEGAGAYFEGNIIFDAEKLTQNVVNAIITFSNNILPMAWNGPGGGNLTNGPLLRRVPALAETQFGTWEAAQIMWEWLSPQPGSPALSAGADQRMLGASIKSGVFVRGEPPAVTGFNSASLKVGYLAFNPALPTGPTAFPQGSGFTHYRWRLDDASWSADTRTTNPILLSNLSEGPHTIQVIGRFDSGLYQDDTAFGRDAVVTSSRTWTVDSSAVTLRLNELLARNRSTLVTNGESPDLVELYNAGSTAVSLAGVGLSDDPLKPYKFTFPAGTMLAPGAYVVLLGETGPDPARYLGFGLNNSGDRLILSAPQTSGGALLDSVVFGLQIDDFSIGRLSDGSWGLCRPTFGFANQPQSLGDPYALRINEWLAASGTPLAADDFVELYNPGSVPVSLQDLFLTDSPAGSPARHRIADLSFIPPRGFSLFKADQNLESGPEHLNFRLASVFGSIGLLDAAGVPIDVICYGPQQDGYSQGRSPNGMPVVLTFSTPTPGVGNPGDSGTVVDTTLQFPLLSLTNTWRFSQAGSGLAAQWRSNSFSDAAWSPGTALFGLEPSSPYPYPLPISTALKLTNVSGAPVITYYFRSTFDVPTNLSGFTIETAIYLDDGAVFYLNGAEVGRLRITNSSVAYGNLAQNQGSEGTRESINIPPSAFRVGTNLIAVEVHQSASNSSDVVFGMSLRAYHTFSVTNYNHVVLNEVLANNTSLTNDEGLSLDFIELYNPSESSVDLSGFSLTDSLSSPTRWIVPAGTVAPGKSLLVVSCDPDSPPSSVTGSILNAGFGLDANGDEVYLFDPGGSLVDSVEFGPQAANFSIVRHPDATPGWQIGLPTPSAQNLAASTGPADAIRLNEWAASSPDEPDWFELFNPGAQPVALGGYYLSDKLGNRTKHLIAPLSFIGVGQHAFVRFIADGDVTKGPDHVNFSLDGTLGEAVGLFPPGTAPAIDFAQFGPQVGGTSEGRLPDGSANRQTFANPSPGMANWIPLTNVVINEVLTHTDLPLEDAVELFNSSGSPVDISGWYLSDSVEDLRKFRVPNGTIILPRAYKVFYEKDFNPDSTLPGSFSFSSAKGDEVWLTELDGAGNPSGERSHVTFGPQFNGLSFGRVLTSSGFDFATLGAPSFGSAVGPADPPEHLADFRAGQGAPNAAARLSPVVMTEIMFMPPLNGTNDNVLHEFIELKNISPVLVPLYDVGHPTNTWRLAKAVEYKFSDGLNIPAGSCLIVVGFDPATNAAALASFRATYGNSGTVVGPWLGKLSNTGETVELQAPDAPQTTGPDAGSVPYVTVERVVYATSRPWPTNAAGTGLSLHRVEPNSYGNDPLNWAASVPTVGAVPNTDTDSDGIPDLWESTHGLDPVVSGSALDPDGDGQTNLQEYLAGTDPLDPQSALRVSELSSGSAGVELRFVAAAGRSYSIVYRSAAGSGTWQKLNSIPVSPSSVQVSIVDTFSSGTAARYYRLVTPALP